MKKRLLIGVLVLMVSLTGCTNNTNQKVIDQVGKTEESKPEESKEADKQAPAETKKEEKQENASLTTVKIISAEVGQPIGDRTADNVGQENGEYFAMGSDIVKCSDYDNVHVVAELTNNRDILLNTSAAAWSAKLEDGYKLELFQDGNGVGMMNDGDLGKQIQSGSAVTVEFDILKEKTVKGDKVILTYWDVNFGEEFNEFMSKAMSGASEKDMKKDYPQFFDESLHYNFEVPLN